MTPTYNLAPIPLWPLHDNAGNPLSNGAMFTYDDTNRSLFKPVYQDPAGILPYTQPVGFNGGGFAGPFYWASDDNYFLQIYDSAGNLVRTIQAYNAPNNGGSTPITVFQDVNNLVVDSQFNYPIASTIPITQLNTQVTSLGWNFQKDNLTATDTITFVAFSLGATPPTNTPINYANVLCSSAGGGETIKYLYYKIPKVESLNNSTISFSFFGINNAINPNISVLFGQNFGTGGSPSPTAFSTPTSFTLTSMWAPYSGTVSLPMVGGKTLGTNGDDYLYMIFSFPINSTFSQSITNIQLVNSPTQLPYDYKSPPQQIGFPYYNSKTARDLCLSIDSNGILGWNAGLPIGTIIMWPNILPLPPTNQFVPCNGAIYPISAFPYAYPFIGNTFGGTPGVSFAVPDLRGLYVRGFDAGRGLDPSPAFGIYQPDIFASHTHGIAASAATGGGANAASSPAATQALTTAPAGGAETKPKSMSLTYLIKLL